MDRRNEQAFLADPKFPDYAAEDFWVSRLGSFRFEA
jgi:hypothetical protein